jgi:alpha-tubulin suppressor-like RCC1 family protein
MCWGDNSLGQLGKNSGNPGPFLPGPTASLSATRGVAAVEVAAGTFHTCALLSDFTISCWGDNDKGQLAANVILSFSLAPLNADLIERSKAYAAENTIPFWKKRLFPGSAARPTSHARFCSSSNRTIT